MQDLKIRANLVLRPVFLIHREQLALVAVLGAVSDLQILKSSMKRKENKIKQKTTTKLGNRSSLDVIRPRLRCVNW